jgi:hypothetical protein
MSETVLLRDAARELGGYEFTISLLDRVQARVTEDPLGRLVVSAESIRAARQLVRVEHEREQQDRSDFAAWEADRRARYRAARKQAYDAAIARRLEAQREHARKINAGEVESGWAHYPPMLAPDAAARTAARLAATEAGQRFDAKEPELGFDEWRRSKVARRFRKTVGR